MTSRELETLAGIGQLKRTTPNDAEIDTLVRSGEARLKDAGNASLAPGDPVRPRVQCRPRFLDCARNDN